ncbi:hypothetical protein [Cystobacter fuscus]|uniref:hypothetical protein n=1 Tax=Cystobacter fuscus TaxID=43 RepID=UPI0005BE1571|nr:hypothetical protein [Cystobacter fuscus]
MTASEKTAAAFGLSNVTLRIEKVREEAGQDVEKLAALSAELERALREEFPDEPLIAHYAKTILANFCLLARNGLFPEIFREEL